jgi:hypothetical protein
MRPVLFLFVLVLTSFSVSGSAFAAILARDQLAVPLAPDMPDRLSIPMPTSVDPNQPIWVAYRVLAMSADSASGGEILLDGSFEGVVTPMTESVVRFTPAGMTVSSSGGTIQQQFEATYGKRDAAQMQALLGPELYAAYQALNAGSGRIFDGSIVKRLPALGKPEGTLLVSVDRATGIRPVGVFVTVGQGDIPPEFGADVAGSAAFGAGRILGILAFLGLLYWFFVGRRKD